MGEHKGWEVELDADVAFARKQASKIDAIEAAERCVEKLGQGKGYFVWTGFIAENERAKVWMLRIPRNDLPEATWLDKEKACIVHFCRPIQLLDAVEAGDKDRTVAHTGYVVDSECVRCNRQCEEKLYKHLRNLVAMHEVSRKVRGGS